MLLEDHFRSGTYRLDDNNIGGTSMAVGAFDIASFEVLRGPQGTLYGSNNTGGTFIIILRSGWETDGSLELNMVI